MAVGPLMKATLARYGLSSLTNWAATMIQNGASAEEMELSLWERPEFKARFPAIAHREKYGYPPISVDEYLSYENTINQVAKSYGVTISKERVDALVSLNVSANEAEERLGMAARAVYQTDTLTRQKLSEFYGIETGDLVNFWLNPREELPVLQRKFVTSQIAGEAKRAGFDNPAFTSDKATYLYNRGMTGEQAAESFGTLVENEELLEAVDDTEQDIGLDDQLKLITGDVDVAKNVEKRAQKRVAAFEGGGSFASGQTGVSGLGSSNK